MEKNRFRIVDLFAGCGGLSYGFNKNPAFEHVLATDIWEQAKKTYENNFKDSKYILSDLSKKEELDYVVSSIGTDIDLLIGGPPCKGFSTLNNSKVHSKFNTLVDQYLEVVKKVKPKIFLIENVRGFQSKLHPSEVTYPEHVKKRLASFKKTYLIHEFLLNAHDYGLAQNRVRYFMLGVNTEIDPTNEFIKLFKDGLKNNIVKNKSVLRDVISDLPKVGVREGHDKVVIKNGATIYNHKSMNHTRKLEERFSHVPKDGGLINVPYNLLTNHLKKVIDGGYGSGGFAKNIYGRMNWEKPSGTIVAGMDKITVGRFVHPEENRLLTPRECARIQSFPDDFQFLGGMVSQYYQIGNAVPPKISLLFSKLLSDNLNKICKTKEKELSWN